MLREGSHSLVSMVRVSLKLGMIGTLTRRYRMRDNLRPYEHELLGALLRVSRCVPLAVLHVSHLSSPLDAKFKMGRTRILSFSTVLPPSAIGMTITTGTTIESMPKSISKTESLAVL